MAGGSQIIISSDGITIKTPKEFKVFAGQHKFEGGQQVPVPQTSLPTFQTPFSNRVDYSWKASSLGEKEIFILDKADGNLIKNEINELDTENNISSLRFYTPEKTDFSALGFNSLRTHLIQENLEENDIDELLEEVEGNDIFDDDQDDIYTEKDI